MPLVPATPSISASDLYRFVSVRGANSAPKTAMTRRFILFDQSIQDAAFIAADNAANAAGTPITPLLIFDLPLLPVNAGISQQRDRALLQFRSNSANVIQLKDFDSIYPTGLPDLMLWHWQNNEDRSISPAAFQQELESILDLTIATFLAANDYYLKKLRLWENLVAEYINPGTSELLARLTDMIRCFWIMEKINNGKLADGQDIYEAMHATVVLPANLPLDQPLTNPGSEPQTKAVDPNVAKDRDIKWFKALDSATTEIMNLTKVQSIDDAGENAKEPAANVQKIRSETRLTQSVLSKRYVDQLGGATHNVLDQLNVSRRSGLAVDQAMQRIAQERQRLTDHYSSSGHGSVTIQVNGSIIRVDNLCYHYTPTDPCAPYSGPTLPKRCGVIRKPGIADLKIIKSVLLKYERGEIAHIENVLLGEVKVREFNTLNRTEQTLFTEQDTTSQTEKETQSTDRFELQKELSTMTKEDMKFDTGVKVSASLGPVSIDSHLDFSYGTSKEESNKTDTRNSQELVNRALSRVIETTKTQKTVTTILQTNDNNKHSIDNTQGPNNIHGIYYWLDKYYLAKVVNYGKRTMFEFIIPEPAAFYIYSKTNPDHSLDKDAHVKPSFPSLFSPALFIATGGKQFMAPLTSFKDITEANYGTLAAQYNAQDVKPPVAATVVISESVQGKSDDQDIIARDRNGNTITYQQVLLADKTLNVPDGYVANKGYVTVAGWGIGQASGYTVMMGDIRHDSPDLDYTLEFDPLIGENGNVPFALWGYNTGGVVVNIEVVCTRTIQKMDQWRIDTLNSIMTAYNTQLAAYETWVNQQQVGAGISIQGNNPDMNRSVEKEELKKHCIEMMTAQRFETFDAMKSNVPDLGFPEFSFNEANAEGNYIQFFEQAFEWEQMTYLFYPYFWGRKPNWLVIKSINDPDPLFTNFLQAGAARVLVPARPGYEMLVAHFFCSNGQIWNGKNPPIPGDPLWISIVDEIKEQEGQFSGGVQEGDPWIYKVPTSLVYLDDVGANLLDNSTQYPNDVKIATAPKEDNFS